MNKILLCVLFLFSGLANSAEKSFQCNNCVDPTSTARNGARQLGLYTGDIINIVDFHGYTTSTYRVNAFPNARDPSMTVYTVSPISTSSRVNALVVETKQLMQSHTTAAKKGVIDLSQVVNPCIGRGQTLQSSWDLVNCPGAQSRLLNYIYNNNVSSLAQDVAALLNIIKHELDLPFLNQKTNLTFTLSDGATVVLTFSYTSSAGQTVTGGNYKIDLDNSTDAEGNPLLMSAASSSSGTGGVYFEGGAQSSGLAAFLAAAGRAGLVVDINTQGSGSMKCSMSSNGQVMYCHYTFR